MTAQERFMFELGKQLDAYVRKPRCGLDKETTFRLVLIERNQAHAKFNMLDPRGASCGVLTIAVKDLHSFTALNWKGKVKL